MRAIAPVMSLAFLAGLAAQAPSAAESYEATNIELVRVIGVVEIQTGGVDRVTVDYDPGEGLADPPRFDVHGDTLEISQLSRFERMDCRRRFNDRMGVRIERGPFHDIEEFGVFVIRIPANAEVSIGGGAVRGEIGDVRRAELGVSSCGDLTVGDIAEDARLAVNGSGDLRAGGVGGDLAVAVNGSGDVDVGDVEGELDVAMNGSGDIRVQSVRGDVNAAIRGSGDVAIRGGEAGSVRASIMGSGDLRFDGVAEEVSLSAFGSGDIFVAEVTGSVHSSSFGSGRVRVGER